MGTKNNPGKFDCYANAEPDEPMFVLLARDRLAGHLVEMWSMMRRGDVEGAEMVFDAMRKHGEHYKAEPDKDKAREAHECALAMGLWRREHRQA